MNQWLKNFSAELGPLSGFIIGLGLFMAALSLLGLSYSLIKILLLKRKGANKKSPDHYRNELLDQIEIASKEALKDYLEQSFFQQDIKLLESKEWYKKLDGLLAFDILLPQMEKAEVPSYVFEKIEGLIIGEHPLVSALALKVTVASLKPNKLISLLIDLDKNEFYKENILLDTFMDSYAAKKEELHRFLISYPDSKISKIILKSILKHRGKESIPTITRLLREKKIKSPSNIKTIIKVAGALRIKEVKEDVKEFVTHEDTTIAIASLFTLSNIAPNEYHPNFFQELREGLKDKDQTDQNRIKEVLRYLGGVDD